MKALSLIAASFALLTFSSAHAADTIRLCSGSETGVYFDAANTIIKMAGPSLKIENVATTGAIDNIDKTLDTDDCDAMISQPDGPVVISRQSPGKGKKLRQIGQLHREYLHVLCSAKSGITDLSQLADDPKKYSLDVGAPGSGGWLIWQNIIAEDDSYAEIPVKNEGGMLALSSVAADDTTCMLVPAGLKNGTVNEADSSYGDSIVLVSADDKDFNDAVDVKGDPLYTYVDIPGSTYPLSLQTGLFSGVETISWNAAVYVNPDRIDPKLLPKFIQIVARAANGIRADYGK